MKIILIENNRDEAWLVSTTEMYYLFLKILRFKYIFEVFRLHPSVKYVPNMGKISNPNNHKNRETHNITTQAQTDTP